MYKVLGKKLKNEQRESPSLSHESEVNSFEKPCAGRLCRAEQKTSRFLCGLFKRTCPSGGFTLIEVLVSLGIFSVSMLVATGAVFTIVNANKKAHSLKSVMTNLNSSLESMTRDIRVGKQYVCITTRSNCPSGDTGIEYTSNRDRDGDLTNDLVDYTFANNRIYRRVICTNSSAPGCDASAVPITSSEIYIQNMKFYVLGNLSAGGDGQPRMLITLSGYANTGDTKSTFNIQTTVAQRIRNN